MVEVSGLCEDVAAPAACVTAAPSLKAVNSGVS